MYAPSFFLPLVYLTFQEVWMNICIRDYLAPSMVLNKSDVSMFDYHHVVFITAAFLVFWDYKFTLFGLGPIYLVG
jgi:hypothetical protein